MMQLTPLFTLTGSAVVEKLGKVQDGERIKIEFRGASAAESPIVGKAHGATWVFIGALGPGDTNAVQEIVTAAGERLVVEVRGYTLQHNGDGMEIRAAGLIRSAAPSFAHLNGHVALLVQQVRPDETATVQAYAF